MTMRQITPNEIARKLGITGLQFRNWLRDKWRAGDPRFADHRINDRWAFSPATATQLEREFRDERSGGARPARVPGPSRPAAGPSTAAAAPEVPPAPTPLTDAAPEAHRVSIQVDGEPVATLADLLRPGLLAVVVGINPAPVSVAAGHYWQGGTGSTLWRRLRTVGLFPEQHHGFEDDAAFAAGVGFTDVVKRPTRGADEVTYAELAAGRADLETKLAELDVPLVIFAFKKAATTLLGEFAGNGFVKGLKLGSSRVFVMPGPYEASATANRTLDALTRWVRDARPS